MLLVLDVFLVKTNTLLMGLFKGGDISMISGINMDK